MSLVVLEDAGLSFAERVIFEHLDLRIGDGERIGLVGPNGSGKSTILRVLSGQQSLDKGNMQLRRAMRIGYLPQDIELVADSSLRDYVLSSVPGRVALDSELADCEAQLAALDGKSGDGTELMDLAGRIADLHERIDHFERYYSEHEALRILGGLGFAAEEWQRHVGELSGGWKMRAVLAALLFQQPDLMLLDEPTNHLDMPSVAWFSEFLRRYKRSFILISHDREFLNEQISRVVSFEVEGVRQYKGNYEAYKRQRAEESEVLENKAKNLAREREQMERFVERFRAKASKAAAVQSRVKALEKMESVETFSSRRVMRFSFPEVSRTVNEVVRIEGLRKAYGDHVVFRSLDLVVRRGEKIGIIGSNGAGKTTLLRMIAGEIDHDAGTIRIGSNVEVGYYAQHHADTLHRDSTAFEEVARVDRQASPNRVRSVLGAFLFSGDDVDKKVSVLSGGERARVALARLLLRPGHLLLMDEPTNHLDLESSESLGQALIEFEGTLIFVSHNRSLVRQLATTIWNVEDGSVEVYGGTLDEYLHSCALRREGDSAGAGVSQPIALSQTPEVDAVKRKGRQDDKERKRREAELRKQRTKTLGPLQKKVATLEERISELETEQADRSLLLSDPDVYADSARRDTLLKEFQGGAEKLEELSGRWEHALEELETLEASLAALESES